MKEMKLKVCGMKHPANISGLINLKPDFIGFIFYEKSSRYVKDLNQGVIEKIPAYIQKVGVFVNASTDEVLEKVAAYKLDYVQLHGDETVEYIELLKSHNIRVIKVFSVDNELPKGVEAYEGKVDLFLFDTATRTYGGSGKHFDWNLLKNYNYHTPYLLSGGITLGDLDEIKEMKLKGLIGLDVNSKFEIEPGYKDLGKVEQLKVML